MSEIFTACPCQSGKNYTDCCQPFHLYQQTPATAEQLMRSRYSAYALGKVDYVVATTVPAQQAQLNQKAMQAWADNTDWQGLEIRQHLLLGERHAMVEFNAFFADGEGQAIHHEYSLFVQIDGRWYFFDHSQKLPKPKLPCVCGSGNKFKNCCGKFLA